MATSGTETYYIINNSSSRIAFEFVWEVTSQSIPNNSSVISWKFNLVTSGTILDKSWQSGNYGWGATVDGATYSGSHPKSAFVASGTLTVASGTAAMLHNSSGERSFDFSCSLVLPTFSYFNANIGNVSAISGNRTHIGTVTLPDIPVCSKTSASNGTLGKAQTLTVTRDSSDFTHTITYKCGTASGTICTKSSSTSISFTPPLSLASQNPTGSSVSVTLTTTTYTAAGESIGSTSTTISCAIPESVKPTISIAVSDPMGYAPEYGYYIQKKSKIGVVITAAGAYGSTIAAYKTDVNGKSYATASVETDVITGTGTLTITSTVTDTRGRQATEEKTITVAEYNTPGITELSVRRTNADGTSNSSGGYLTITFDAAATSLDGQNSAIYTLQYKKASDTNYTSVSLTAFSGLHYVDDGTFTFAADKSSTYNLILTIADDFGSTYRIGAGSPAQKLFSILFRGLGFAFGKDAELEGVLDIGFQTKFTGGILHPVLESGTDLNDVLTPNTYTAAAFDVWQFGHFPDSGVTVKGFVLEVITAGTSGELIQRATVFTDSGLIVYHRLYSGGVWAAWTL